MAGEQIRDARDYLSDDQVALLLKPIHPNRVLARDGLSYVEGYDIRAELNRVFGFGRWSQEILKQDVVCETATKTKAGREAWYVVYRTTMRLTVHAPGGRMITFYDGSHVGESTHPVRGEAHGNAVTNSETYALRRCAINLGDQFGLSLYNKGSMEAVVRWTLVRPVLVTPDTDDVPQVEAETEENAAPGDEGQQPQEQKVMPVRRRTAVKVAEDALTRVTALIDGASTLDELRVCWGLAGDHGLLRTVVPWREMLPDGTEVSVDRTIQEKMVRTSDEITFRPGTGSPGSLAGAGLAGSGD